MTFSDSDSNTSSDSNTRARKRVRKAVIPAAGLGTRFLPASKAVPKEMLPLVDKPVIQYIVEDAVASGIEEVVIVTAAAKRAIEDHFDRSGSSSTGSSSPASRTCSPKRGGRRSWRSFVFVRQGEPLGNGHAVLTDEGRRRRRAVRDAVGRRRGGGRPALRRAAHRRLRAHRWFGGRA